MIKRYSPEDISKIWEEENKFRLWLEIEKAVAKAEEELGIIPEGVYKELEKAKINTERIKEIEKTTNHDVIAFVESIQEQIGDLGKRYIHYGLTSSDVVDTGTSLQIKESLELIEKEIEKLREILKDLALKYKDTVIMGRTHGVYAEPMSFGLKFLLYYQEFSRHLKRLKEARKRLVVGKISGAVGTFSQIPPDVEERVCKILGIEYEPVSTQIVQRDRHSEYLYLLALIGTSISRIAIEIRHLQRSEVREVEEPFMKGQKGSSAMPHKRNPILSERMTGLSRVLRGNSLVGLENMELWHERDISHSSAERITLADSSILVVYMLRKMQFILENLIVYEENMKRHIEEALELYFSQKILLFLVEKGFSRVEAYKIVQENAMRSWSEKKPLSHFLLKDERIKEKIDEESIKKLFNIKDYLKNIDRIYKRVLNQE